MAKVKSTIDLIMEKTKHLSLNEEEKDALDQKELHRRVQALLIPYLKGERDANYLAQELDRFSDDTVGNGRKLCLELLMDRISPFEDKQRIFSAVAVLAGETERKRWEDSIAPLETECLQALRNAWEASADRCREVLAEAGLKGPALLPRVSEQDPAWKEEREKHVLAFHAGVKKVLGEPQT